MYLVGLNDVTDRWKIVVGENKANVALHVRQQLFQAWILFQLATNAFPDCGVFPH